MTNHETVCREQRLQTYKVQEIACILNISIRKAYDLVNNSPGFEVIKVGKCIRVKKPSFDQWFDSCGV